MKAIVLSFAAGLAAAVATSASAGTCPADQVHVDARTSGETMPVKVTDTELSFVALGGEINGLDNRRLRLRRLVVQPGGVVPWHSHEDRPALIYVVEGTVTEYASNCAVPIVHKAGEVSVETKEVAHWWKNTGNTVVKLLSSDVFHDQKTASTQ
jgi:quercetin dioxygenase-like cupin family protein